MGRLSDQDARNLVESLLVAIDETVDWPALESGLREIGIADPETALEQLRAWAQG